MDFFFFLLKNQQHHYRWLREVCGSGSPAAVHSRSTTTGIFLETSAEPKEKPPDLSDAATLHLFAFDFEQPPIQDRYSEHNQADVLEISPQGWFCL